MIEEYGIEQLNTTINTHRLKLEIVFEDVFRVFKRNLHLQMFKKGNGIEMIFYIHIGGERFFTDPVWKPEEWFTRSEYALLEDFEILASYWCTEIDKKIGEKFEDTKKHRS